MSTCVTFFFPALMLFILPGMCKSEFGKMREIIKHFEKLNKKKIFNCLVFKNNETDHETDQWVASRKGSIVNVIQAANMKKNLKFCTFVKRN